MQGTKPEIKKPVVLKELLMGIENVYNPICGTLIKISCETNCCLNGHRAWLRLMMPAWIKQLNFYGGGNVVSWSIDKSKSSYNSQINMEMFFQGALSKSKLHPKTAEMFSGQIRKLMALQILEKFPPPFDVREPLFAANIPDLITLKLFHAKKTTIDNFLKTMEDKTGEIAISDELEKHGAHFVSFFKKNILAGSFMEYGIIFKWHLNMDKNERASIFYEKINPFFDEKFGITSTIKT